VQLHVGLMKINDGIKDLKILILGLTLQNLLQKISFLLKRNTKNKLNSF
jgi:hypothetical protein